MAREEESELDQLAQADNSMGELSEDIFDERGGWGDKAQGDPFESGKQLPPDIAYQVDVSASAQGAPLGTLPQKTRVQTVFDARPTNSRDFSKSSFETMSTTVADVVTPASLIFTIPKGYIGILRGFRWSFNDNLPYGISADSPNNFEFQAAIYVEDTVQEDYDQLGDLGIFLNDLQPCYILANELKNLELRLTPITDTGTASSADVRLELYGNLLLRKGIPLPFEPGSY